MSGATDLIVNEDEEFGYSLISALRPRSFYPAPPIFRLPEEVSPPVRQSIEMAFELFWVDISSASNRLRTSVEYLLDDLAVPRVAISKKKAPVALDLNGRIQLFSKQDRDYGQQLDALRMVGNLGTHTTDLEHRKFLDAAEIYDETLQDLIGGRKKRLKALADKIVSTKAKY